MQEISSAAAMPATGESFLIVGYSGSGKTSLGLTLPRPSLFIFFDPSGADGIRSFPGVDFVSFLPTETGIMPVGGIAAKKRDDPKARVPELSAVRFTPKTYLDYLAWWNCAIKDGTFVKYRSVILDSTTFLELAIIEWVMTERNAWGGEPGPGEYAQFRSNLCNVATHLISLSHRGIHVMLTSHIRDKTDLNGNVVGKMLKVSGAAREDLPGSFANVFVTNYDRIGAKYFLRTKPGDDLNLGKSSRKRLILPYEIDVTIKDWDHPEKFGLGRIIHENLPTATEPDEN